MHPVYKPKISLQQRRELWTQIVADYKQSKLSRKEFCSQNGLKVDDLDRWTYRINKDNLAVDKPRKKTAAFLPVTLAKTKLNKSSHNSGWKIKLDFNDFCSININKDTPLDVLKSLISILRSQP